MIDHISVPVKNFEQSRDAVVLDGTEYPLVVDRANSALPIIDPVYLQAQSAIDYALRMMNRSLQKV